MITIGYVEPGHEEQFSGMYDDYVLLPFGKLNTISTLDEAKDFIKLENAKAKPEWPFNSRTIYIFEDELVIGNVRPKKN
ncbi:hypothetical protein [Pedobacter sp. L105]|uniref:hypothetical protein n=1 Tax=Pedobacter sp. L105 TaxID=1641871 RepID=UPI00131CC6AD|nr:hypothetical protein [Pedobacter sp. L105]